MACTMIHHWNHFTLGEGGFFKEKIPYSKNILPLHFSSQGYHENPLLHSLKPLVSPKTPKAYGFHGAHTPWRKITPHHEVIFSTTMLSPTKPFTQGFSSLPRVSEAFTPMITFNIQIKKIKSRKEAKKFYMITIHIHTITTPYQILQYKIHNTMHDPMTNTPCLQICFVILKWTWFESSTLVQAKGNDSCSRAPLIFLQTLTVSKLREWVNNPLIYHHSSKKTLY